MAPLTPSTLRLTQTIGITSSLILAGNNLAFSFFAVPRILESPADLCLKQWRNMFEAGKLSIPPAAALTSAIYFYLSYNSTLTPSSSTATSKSIPGALSAAGEIGLGISKSNAYLVAGILTIGIIPYTILVMKETNGKLLGNLGTLSMEGKGKDSVKVLVDWWGVLNLVRGAMLSAGGALAVWTSLC